MKPSSRRQLEATSGQSPTPQQHEPATVAEDIRQAEQQEHPYEDHDTGDAAASPSEESLPEPELGYKYGYHPQPAFERVSHWELPGPFELEIPLPQTARRKKNKPEREITPQLPAWQPVELGDTWLEESAAQGEWSSDDDFASTKRVNPQRESKFVTLLSEDVRYAIYMDCLAIPRGNARWSFSPLSYKARYEDEHGVPHPQERIRTTLLLCCRQLYLEVRPCLLRLLKNATMTNLAPRFLPWCMPSSNLASIRSLSWHFFFEIGPGIYVPSDLAGDQYQGTDQPRNYTSSFEYAAAWDVVLSRMPCLQELRFRGYLRAPKIQSSTTAIFAIHEAKVLDPLRRAQEARRSGSREFERGVTCELDRLLVELHWPSRHDQYAEWQKVLKEQWKAFVTTLYRSEKRKREEREFLQNATDSTGSPKVRQSCSSVPSASRCQETNIAAAEAVEHDPEAHILQTQPESRSLTEILAAPGCDVAVRHLFARKLDDLQERYCGQAMYWHLDPIFVRKLKAGKREIRPFTGEESWVTDWNVDGS